jgi:selenocysteine-specific elongation factor
VPTVATAGHVDHGKSTLVRALTGTDPDRLAQERARGLTIDLGFASLVLPSGRTVGFVDVPGHERYLKNMLAGVGAVTACVLVVAADEGWKPQTEEHLRVIDLLGVDGGIVVVTKCAVVDADRRDLTVLDVEDRLLGSRLEGAPVLCVDSVTGDGLGALPPALDALVDRVAAPVDDGRTRLWIDRSFAVAGAGAVVTGTLGRGTLAVGDVLEVAGAAVPAGTTVRVRGLQHHHGTVPRIGPGERVAVNLTGTSHHDLRRGDALVAPGRWFRTTTVDASLSVLPALGHDVSRRGAYTAHIGSGEHPVRVRVLGPDRLEAGTTGAVRLHLAGPLPLVPGDRYVLREAGRHETVGGGEVLDVEPVLAAARARPDRSPARVVAERGHVDAAHLELLTGVPATPDVGRWVLDPAALSGRRARLAGAVRTAGTAGIPVAALDEVDRAVLAAMAADASDGTAAVVVRNGVARTAGHAVHRDGAGAVEHPWVQALRDDPLGGAGPHGVDPDEVRELRRSGRVVLVDGAWFARDGLDELVPALARLLDERPEGVGIAAVRERLGGSRRTVVPFLTWCDEQGVTRRRGDVRIPGPRLHRDREGPAGPEPSG